MQNNISRPFEKIFEEFDKRKVENALAEISSCFISAKPNSKNNANLKVYSDAQRMGYKSRAYTGYDTRLHSFNGK